MTMKAAGFSETSVDFYQVTRCHTPSAKSLNSTAVKVLKSHWMHLAQVGGQSWPIVNTLMNTPVP